MEITLEKIELVKDRTGASYKEAKEALEKTDGNVVDAIILIEESINGAEPESKNKITGIIDSIKEIVNKGNVSKIIIRRNGEILLNLPVNVGVLGTVLCPWGVIAGAIAAFGTKCNIELIKDNGEIIDVSSKAGEAFEAVKSKGGVVFDEVKDKGSDAWDIAKEKSKQAWDVALDKGKDAFDTAKEKAVSAIKKSKDEFIDAEELSDLDLSDIDFSELEDDNE